MAKETFKTPIGTARWAHLIQPRAQFDKTKPPAWSVELLLPATDKNTISFLSAMEDQLTALHGSKKKRSQYAFPFGEDKEDPTMMVVKFKIPQFTKKDGTLSDGPRVVDAKKQPWNGEAIGNGSKIIVAFNVYSWESDTGCGMTFQPRAVQVVELVEYVAKDPAADFEEVEGGYSVSGSAAGRSWAFDDDEPSF